MSYSISSLLTRISTTSSVKRRHASAAPSTRSTPRLRVLRPTKGVYRGATDRSRRGQRSRLLTLTFRYQPIVGPEELGNGGRIQWVSAALVRRQLTAGTDFIIGRDGRIAALYLFFDKLP